MMCSNVKLKSMEYEYSDDKMEMLYETLSNIELAITRLQERTNQVHSADDFRLSPWGMEKLDAACMVLIAIGESVKTLDKFKKISNGGSAGSQLLIIDKFVLHFVELADVI